MLVYTYMYKNHSSDSGYVRWACGHGPKSRLTMFSAPLGIEETQKLSWVQVQRVQAHPTALQAPYTCWVKQERFCTHSFTQSPNTHSRHTLHFSRNQECPFLDVLNSITKTTVVLVLYNHSTPITSECSKRQIDINTPEELKPSSVIQNCVMLLCPSQKYPPSALLTCKTRVGLRVSSQAFIWPTELSPISATRLRKGGSTSAFPLICWITDDHWTVAGYWGRKSTTCREAGEEAP